ncbi:carboxypeptidase-like regulatory domain-containing protein [Bacteroidota bacterium]
MKIKLISLIVLTFFCSKAAFSQNVILTGQVIEYETEETLMTVSISIEKHRTGTVTDMNGNFKLEVYGDTEAIKFSYIGYYDIEFINVPFDTDTIKIENLKMFRDYSTHVTVELQPDMEVDKSKEAKLKAEIIENYNIQILNSSYKAFFKDNRIVFDFKKK